MKKLIIHSIFSIATLAICCMQSGCNKALNLKPLDQLSDAAYWQSASDFQLAANAFYTYERSFLDVIFDIPVGVSANANPHADMKGDLVSTANAFSRGTNTAPTTDNIWTTNGAWNKIRNTNYLIAKAASYPRPAEIARYVAEAKFFRAYVYFDLLQVYGAVPLILTPITPDSMAVYGPRTIRDSVVNQIIADLNAAIPNLPLQSNIGDNGRVSKGAAQAFLSRVALYEGTWQEFRGNTSRANPLLDIAIAASDSVMVSNQYSLFAPAVLGDSAQKYLFILENNGTSGTGLTPPADPRSNPAGLQKSANNEYILANRYDHATRQIRQNVTHTMFGYDLTKNFANLYLCNDGLPIDKSPLFQGYATMNSEFINRDNRMRYNMMVAGQYYWSGNANWREDYLGDATERANSNGGAFKPYNNSLTGYHNQKWAVEKNDYDNEEAMDYPVIRYAEVLLNYAEAVFERNGSISNADLDKSLNIVRLRVNKDNGMPGLSNELVGANGLDMRTEIRRERTIELYLEGFRVDDLKRWHDLASFQKPLLGITWTGTQFQTTWPTQSTIPKDANGNLIVDNIRNFSEKDFLWPIPTQQLQLNPALGQNPGW